MKLELYESIGYHSIVSINTSFYLPVITIYIIDVSLYIFWEKKIFSGEQYDFSLFLDRNSQYRNFTTGFSRESKENYLIMNF